METGCPGRKSLSDGIFEETAGKINWQRAIRIFICSWREPNIAAACCSSLPCKKGCFIKWKLSWTFLSKSLQSDHYRRSFINHLQLSLCRNLNNDKYYDISFLFVGLIKLNGTEYKLSTKLELLCFTITLSILIYLSKENNSTQDFDLK